MTDYTTRRYTTEVRHVVDADGREHTQYVTVSDVEPDERTMPEPDGTVRFGSDLRDVERNI